MNQKTWRIRFPLSVGPDGATEDGQLGGFQHPTVTLGVHVFLARLVMRVRRLHFAPSDFFSSVDLCNRVNCFHIVALIQAGYLNQKSMVLKIYLLFKIV